MKGSDLEQEKALLSSLAAKEVLAYEHRLPPASDGTSSDQEEQEEKEMRQQREPEEKEETKQQSDLTNHNSAESCASVAEPLNTTSGSTTAHAPPPQQQQVNRTPRTSHVIFDSESSEAKSSSSIMMKASVPSTTTAPTPTAVEAREQTPLSHHGDTDVSELRQKVAALQAALTAQLLATRTSPQRTTGGTFSSPLSQRTPLTHRKPRTLLPLSATAPDSSSNVPHSSSSPHKQLLFSPNRTAGDPTGGDIMTSSSLSPTMGARPQPLSQRCNPRRLRDGLAAMSTEVRNEDFATIIAKRELRLVAALDERKALQKKVQALSTDVAPLEAQRDELASLRQQYHAQVRQIHAEEKEVQQELHKLRWEETKLHEQVTLVTRTLQSFRHQRSEAEMKVLGEFNQVSFELQNIQKALREEDAHYESTWKQLRGELRLLQEAIVVFNPQEYLAATVAAGLEKKQLAKELGDSRQAEKFLSSALGAADRRKTVMKMEKQREGLDSFLQGS